MKYKRHKSFCVMSLILLSIIIFMLLYECKFEQLILFLTMIATAFIACIAYYQLNKITEINLSDHLLKLDQLWHTAEIIQARKIIDVYFQRIYRVKNKKKKFSYDTCMRLASEEIYRFSKSDTENEIEKNKSEFLYLLSLIEFFDTLGFIYSKGFDDQKDEIKILFKNSVKFYYEINQVYIDHIHATHGQEDRFKNFQNIYNEFKRDES